MTLNTRVHIAKPIHAKAFFKHILVVLESDPEFDRKATWREFRKGDEGESENRFHTVIGQGLAAIWKVEFSTKTPMQYLTDEELADPDDNREAGPYNTHFVSASLDTAYSYRAANGANCGDLHAFLLREINAYLDDLGVTEWAWLYEEQGMWYEPDQYQLRGNAELGSWPVKTA